MAPELVMVARPDGVSLATVLHRHAGRDVPVVSLRPPQFSHVVREWEAGYSHHEFGDYREQHPVLRYDPRGTGLSTRGSTLQSLEAWVEDLGAVLDAHACRKVALDAISSGALTAFAFAARHPERVSMLVVQNAFVSGSRWWNNAVRRALLNIAAVDWTLCTETWAWLTWGDERRDRTLRLAAYIRACIEPADFLEIAAGEQVLDLRREVEAIRCPVLVLNHPRFARMAPESHNAEVALAARDAKLQTIHTASDRVAAINAFLAGEPLPAANIDGAAGEVRSKSVLSKREIEVVRLVAEGRTNHEIGEALTVSVRTVDAHVRHILDKTGSSSRAAAAAYAIRHQLL